MPTTFLFATRADLEPGLRAAEARLSLKYVPTRSGRPPGHTAFRSALDIPELGTADDRLVAACHKYLVFDAAAEVVVDAITQADGDVWYKVNPLHNREGFVFRPGGWYQQTYLMDGVIHVSRDQSEAVKARKRTFVRAVLRGFTPLFNYRWRLGPEALRVLDAGGYLIPYDAGDAPLGILKRPAQEPPAPKEEPDARSGRPSCGSVDRRAGMKIPFVL